MGVVPKHCNKEELSSLHQCLDRSDGRVGHELGQPGARWHPVAGPIFDVILIAGFEYKIQLKTTVAFSSHTGWIIEKGRFDESHHAHDLSFKNFFL